MSNPAANPNWSWEWMGLNPPGLCHNVQSNIFPKYDKFKHCFDAYYGIGDFDYWIKSNLDALSNEDKLELLNLRIEDLKEDIEKKARTYLGLNPDGTFNDTIDPYLDGRTHFFDLLTIEECRDRKYPHNQRCRYTNGFQCDDCGTFFGIETEDYILSEKLSTLSISIWNTGVFFNRKNEEWPPELRKLEKLCKELQDRVFIHRTINEVNLLQKSIETIREIYSYELN